MTTEMRVSSAVREALYDATAEMRVSSLVREVLRDGPAAEMRVSSLAREVLRPYFKRKMVIPWRFNW